MCGIFGMVGEGVSTFSLVEGLKLLEYRGYDSAGIGVVGDDGVISCHRVKGKICELEATTRFSQLSGSAGIAHTRWATHGVPSESNAHPVAKDAVAVVHNGIVDNYQELKEELLVKRRSFVTETDTEVVVHLVNDFLSEGLTPVQAVLRTLECCVGNFAFAFVFTGHSDLIVAASRSAPLVVGYGDKEMFIASDAIAIAPFTDRVTYLEDGDVVALTHSGAVLYDQKGAVTHRDIKISSLAALTLDRGEYEHFMAKEINEQPKVVEETLKCYIDSNSGLLRPGPYDWTKPKWINIAACGTAYYAGLVGKYWFEKFARLPVNVDVSSEFRYRSPPLDSTSLTLLISQSGETADTLAVMRYCEDKGVPIASVVNVMTSSLARDSDVIFPTCAGTEWSVASTKAFTCQLVVLATLAISAGRARGVLSESQERDFVSSLADLPRMLTDALALEDKIKGLVDCIVDARSVFYLGRGTNYPLALEGALKLKEISYIHAEGHASGELKHGSMAFIDEEVPVIIIAPHDDTFTRTLSNIQEVAARGGRVIVLTDEHGIGRITSENVVQSLIMQHITGLCSPMVYAVPLQLLAYHTARILGKDVDRPRNLAKSVTVE